MALETFFQVQVSTLPYAAAPNTSKSSNFQVCHSFYQPEKLNAKSKKSIQSLFSSSTSSLKPFRRNGRVNRFVCEAKNAVDGVVKEVDGASWDSLVLGSETPVVVDFWAPWCGPCRMIAPYIDELAKEYAGKVACYKVNTDVCPDIASKYGIRSIPTVLFFKNGEKKESIIGAVSKSTLGDTIDKYI